MTGLGYIYDYTCYTRVSSIDILMKLATNFGPVPVASDFLFNSLAHVLGIPPMDRGPLPGYETVKGE